MRAGISIKVGLLAVGLVIATAVTVGLVIAGGIRQMLVQKEIGQLQSELQFRSGHLADGIQGIDQDVRFLSTLPVLHALIRARTDGGRDSVTGADSQVLRKRLAEIFTERLRSRPRYFQIRFIGVEADGREVVRVDRRNDDIYLVPDDELQAKGGRDYFQETMRLGQGRVYLSNITLNQEHGRVQVPHIRTLRVAAPVYAGEQDPVGIVIINTDFGPPLDKATRTLNPEYQVMIINDQGDFIAHPDTSLSFGFDLGERHRLRDFYPALAEAMHAPADPGNDSDSSVKKLVSDDELFLFTRIYLDAGQHQRYLELIETAPYAIVVGEATRVIGGGVLWALLLTLVGAVAAFLFGHFLTRRLREISKAAAQVAAGESDIKLPVESQDEIGTLAVAFRHMLSEIESRTTALMARETRLNAILSTVANGVVTIDGRGVIEDVNPSAIELFGYSAEEMIGANVNLLMPSEHAVRHDNYIDNYLRTGEKKIIGKHRELSGRRKDGHIFPILLAVTEARIDGKRLFVGMVQDLTQVHKAEARAREKEYVLKLFLDHLPAVVYAKDQQGRYLLMNGRFKEVFGVDRKQMVQAADDQLGASFGEFLREKDCQVFDHQDLVASDEWWPLEDGPHAYLTHRFPLHDENGRVYGMGAIATDITSRKQSEQQLAAFAERLQASNRELQDFAYIASHDLQEPLRKIQAFGDRLLKKEEIHLSDQGKDYLSRIRNAAARMQELINSLLTLSRVGTRGGEFVPVALGKVARDVVSDLETQISETGAVVDIGELPNIEADPVQMRQLFQNLIGNALKYRELERRPNVKIYALDGDVAKPRNGLTVSLAVEDNGIGFESKYAERIFAPFERLHKRHEYAGTGIGLAICRKIVERHGGRIYAESEPGKGAKFVFSLPRLQVYKEGSEERI